MRKLVSLIVGVLMLQSCNDFGTEPLPGLALSTSGERFVVSQAIHVTVSNHSETVLRSPSCCGENPHFLIQMRIRGAWELSSENVDCSVYDCPPGIATFKPNEPVVRTVTITQPGHCRLLLQYFEKERPDSSYPAYSNEFDVVESGH